MIIQLNDTLKQSLKQMKETRQHDKAASENTYLLIIVTCQQFFNVALCRHLNYGLDGAMIFHCILQAVTVWWQQTRCLVWTLDDHTTLLCKRVDIDYQHQPVSLQHCDSEPHTLQLQSTVHNSSNIQIGLIADSLRFGFRLPHSISAHHDCDWLRTHQYSPQVWLGVCSIHLIWLWDYLFALTIR